MRLTGPRGAIAPRLAAILVMALCGVTLAAGARGLGLRVMQVTSGSMSPTIRTDDWLLTQDLSPRGAAPLKRGDIVVFSYPIGYSGRAIKRIAGLPGDPIVVRREWLEVGGRKARLFETPGVHGVPLIPASVPAGTVFLLGDNLDSSIDSRHFGAAPRSEIFGRVLVHAPPWTVGLTFALAAAILVWASFSSQSKPETPNGAGLDHP